MRFTSIYTDVSENKLLNVPTMDPLRIELLERSPDFFGKIARERPDDPDVQTQVGPGPVGGSR